MQDGWIKIHRGLMKWEWWDDATMVKSWLTILFLCNREDIEWHGQTVKAGSFITSLSRLSESLEISRKKTRTVLDRLKMTGEIETITSKKNTVIRVKNWKEYQGTQNPQPESIYNQEDNLDFCESFPNKRANKGHTEGTQRAHRTAHKGHTQNFESEVDTIKQGHENGTAPDLEIAEKGQQTRIKNKDIDSIYLNICPKISENADLFGNPMPEEIKSCLSFEDFWKIYDKKVDKSACRSLYDKLPETTREEIKRHVPLYVQSTPDKTYRKDPVRYLRHRCWENEIIENTKQPQINREEEGF